jgi:hypothetical protein
MKSDLGIRILLENFPTYPVSVVCNFDIEARLKIAIYLYFVTKNQIIYLYFVTKMNNMRWYLLVKSKVF